MAEPRTNVFGYTARALSATETRFPDSDGALSGVQPFGLLKGNYFAVTTEDLIKRLGTAWIMTEVDAGTDGAGVHAVSPATATKPPFVTLTTNDASGDNVQLQHAVSLTGGSTTLTAWDPFIAKAGYDIHFHSRVQVTTTMNSVAFFLGLAVVDTTLLASSAVAHTSGLGFWKASGASALTGEVRTSSTSTNDALGNLTISTMYDLDFVVNGRTSMTFYVNGVKTGASSLANLPANTVKLCPSIAVSAGTAAVATMEIHEFFVAQEAR